MSNHTFVFEVMKIMRSLFIERFLLIRKLFPIRLYSVRLLDLSKYHETWE
jgi:hypothetical protein